MCLPLSHLFSFSNFLLLQFWFFFLLIIKFSCFHLPFPLPPGPWSVGWRAVRGWLCCVELNTGVNPHPQHTWNTPRKPLCPSLWQLLGDQHGHFSAFYVSQFHVIYSWTSNKESKLLFPKLLFPHPHHHHNFMFANCMQIEESLFSPHVLWISVLLIDCFLFSSWEQYYSLKKSKHCF